MSIVEKTLNKIADAITREGEESRAALRAGFTQSTNASRVNGARYLPLPASSALVWGGPGRLVGWSVQATGGPVRVLFRDGRSADDDVIAVVDLADTEHDNNWIGPGGVSFGEAVYCERTGAGTLTGAVYLGVVD